MKTNNHADINYEIAKLSNTIRQSLIDLHCDRNVFGSMLLRKVEHYDNVHQNKLVHYRTLMNRIVSQCLGFGQVKPGLKSHWVWLQTECQKLRERG